MATNIGSKIGLSGIWDKTNSSCIKAQQVYDVLITLTETKAFNAMKYELSTRLFDAIKTLNLDNNSSFNAHKKIINFIENLHIGNKSVTRTQTYSSMSSGEDGGGHSFSSPTME